jgi:hypothetical protein
MGLMPSTAAASIRLGFGADYWFTGTSEFNFTATPTLSLTPGVSLGGRFGMLLVGSPATAGVPLDLQLRISIQQLYLEGSFGPWILFADHPFHTHGAFGFGLQTGIVSLGVEAGWLDPNALLGIRLGLSL